MVELLAPFLFSRQPHSHSSKNRRIASIEASRILSWPPSHLSTVERDTPSSREIRAFFHSDRSAKVRNRLNISAFSRSLRAFSAASIGLVKTIFSSAHEAQRKVQILATGFPNLCFLTPGLVLGMHFPSWPRPRDHPRRRRDYQSKSAQ